MQEINKEKLKILLARLQRQFDYAYPLEDAQGFFVGIADYVKVVEESDYLVAIVKAFILPERDEKMAEIERASKEVIIETEQTYKQVEKIIKDNKIDSDYVKREVDEYKGILEGRIKVYGRGNIANNQSDKVRDILIAIRESGFEKETESYAEFNEQGILTRWKISETEKKLDRLLERFEEHKKMSIWNAWEQLWWVFTTTYGKFDFQDKLEKNNSFMDNLNFHLLSGDIKKVIDGKEEQRDYKHFNLQEYKRHFFRVQDKIQAEAESLLSTADSKPKEVSIAAQESEKMVVEYNNKDCILRVGKTEIQIKYGSKQADLCKIIFANNEAMKKKWDREEILEEMSEDQESLYQENGHLDPKFRRIVYNAADKLKVKIALSTGITDLLVYDTQSVSVNSKFVS